MKRLEKKIGDIYQLNDGLQHASKQMSKESPAIAQTSIDSSRFPRGFKPSIWHSKDS